jgi:YidC/Oxa1 family membrane protein insertase
MDLIVNPFITLLLAFYSVLGDVFLSIVAFTVVIRLATLPLSLSQQRSMQNMQKLQPQVKEIQEKYKNDPLTRNQRITELYRENRINPLSSCLPLFVQLPILIGLWRAIIATLAATPGQLLDLSERLLVPNFASLVPMDNRFLWMNLAVPDPFLILPVLVVFTTWLQQKLFMPPTPPKKAGQTNKSDDPAEQAAAMTRQMTTIMPIMFGFFALTYSSGLAIYIIVSNIIGILQYTAMGRADFRRLIGKTPLSDDQKKALETYGRLRHDWISDTREVESAYGGSLTESRRSKLRRAKARANRVKLS